MLAIIGGTGLYALDAMRVTERIDAQTPFGAASGPISKGRLGGHEVLFLARHGDGHRLLPHEVNYRANIYALKRAGATQVLCFSAVGSLAERVAPGDLAVPSQYFDWTKGGRERTFFGRGVAAHVSTAEPVSRNLADWIATAAAGMNIRLHRDVTYACVEGPRLGTRAESLFMQQAAMALLGHDAVIGPAIDGGYALIGLRCPQAALFDGIDWSTPRVLAQTRERLGRLGLTWAELAPLHDIDEPADLRHLPAGWAPLPLRK